MTDQEKVGWNGVTTGWNRGRTNHQYLVDLMQVLSHKIYQDGSREKGTELAVAHLLEHGKIDHV